MNIFGDIIWDLTLLHINKLNKKSRDNGCDRLSNICEFSTSCLKSPVEKTRIMSTEGLNNKRITTAHQTFPIKVDKISASPSNNHERHQRKISYFRCCLSVMILVISFAIPLVFVARFTYNQVNSCQSHISTTVEPVSSLNVNEWSEIENSPIQSKNGNWIGSSYSYNDKNENKDTR